MAIANLTSDIIEKLDFLGLEVLKSFQFAVSIDGDMFGSEFLLGFEKVIGLSDAVETRDVKEGGYSGIHRFPRRATIKPIQLVRGMTLNREFYKWFDEVRNWEKGFPSYAKTLSVIMLSHIMVKGEPIQFEVWRFDIIDAWPSEWKGPDLSSQSENLAFESVTLQHGGITRARTIIGDKTENIVSLLQN